MTTDAERKVVEHYADELKTREISRDALLLAKGFQIAAELIKADEEKEKKDESA